MPTKEELTKLVFDYYTHEAKCNVFSDIVKLLKKYKEKQNRALNDAKRKYARVKNSSNSTKVYSSMREEDVLECMIIEVMKLENEFMKRTIDALDEKTAHFEKLEAVTKQLAEEDLKKDGK